MDNNDNIVLSNMTNSNDFNSVTNQSMNTINTNAFNQEQNVIPAPTMQNESVNNFINPTPEGFASSAIPNPVVEPQINPMSSAINETASLVPNFTEVASVSPVSNESFVAETVSNESVQNVEIPLFNLEASLNSPVENINSIDNFELPKAVNETINATSDVNVIDTFKPSAETINTIDSVQPVGTMENIQNVNGSQENLIHCPRCGNARENGRYCSNCGLQLMN